MDSYEASQRYWARQRGEYVPPRPQNYVEDWSPHFYDISLSTYLFYRLLALLLE